jgi:uncharacterized protein YfbU (UPF0304 family)
MSGTTKTRAGRPATSVMDETRPRSVVWRDPAADKTGVAGTADEVTEILVMFSHIEHRVSLLPADEAGLLANYADCTFRGFDRRREPAHFTVACAMVDHSGFFDEFQERKLDSGMPMLAHYRQLIGRFAAEHRGGSHSDFGLDQLRRVLSI